MTKPRNVFIGGLHRSGTTFIAATLAQHPEVSGFQGTGVVEDEGQFLQTVYPTDNEYGGPGRFAFDPAAHLTEESALVGPENAERLRNEWSRYWNPARRVQMEKTPANIIRARFLQALFPEAVFIFVVRHPVATSVATHKWSGTGIYSLVHHWVTAHEMLCGDLPYLRNAFTIRYEDFAADPLRCLRDIERVIGISSFDGYSIRCEPGMNDKYFASWRELFLPSTDRRKPVPPPAAVHAHKRSRWRQDWKRLAKSYVREKLFGEERQLSLTYYEAMDAVSMFEPTVRRWGYSLVDLAYSDAAAMRERVTNATASNVPVGRRTVA